MATVCVMGAGGAADIRTLSDPLNGDAVGPRGTQGDDAAGDSLAFEIRRAGKRMEQAMAAGQRDLAVVWMRCMYGLIGERARRANDIQKGEQA